MKRVIVVIVTAVTLASCGQSAGSGASPAGGQILATVPSGSPATSPVSSSGIDPGVVANSSPTTSDDETASITYEVPATQEVDAIANDPVNRHTILIENRANGTIGWWTTAWTASTAGGVPIICLGSPGGIACAPDESGPVEPVEVRSFSLAPPHGLQVYVQSTVTGLSVRSSSGDELPIGIYDPGLPSGNLISSVALGASPPATITFTGNNTAGRFTIDYQIPAVARTTAPDTEVRADPMTAPYGPPELVS